MYRRLEANSPLVQGEILDNCPILYWSRERQEADWIAVETLARVVILTQACDLENSKTTRVQIALVHEAAKLVEAGVLKPKIISEQLVRHRVYGWYFLPASSDLPESIIDLRDIHTVDRRLLEKLVADGKRVCALETPYREHLAQHFAVTFSRIGLPDAYSSES